MQTPDDDQQTGKSSTDSGLVTRRDAMKAAASAGVITGGFTGIASAQGSCGDVDGPCDDCTDTDCRAQQGDCTPCLGGGCEEIPDSRLEAGTDFGEDLQCVTLSDSQIPDDADLAAIKAANECHECEVVDTSGQTFCIDSKHDISHIEFADCPGAEITVDCPNDEARIDVELTESIYFEVAYTDCDPESELDEPTSGTLTFDDDAAGGTSDDWHTFVALADCEGTITVWNSDSMETKFDEASFDCESGSVMADCEAGITVFAEDTTDLWYEVSFVDCDVDDINRSKVSGLDTADTVTILDSIPNCEGTVRLYEDEMSTETLDSATFDCVSATVTVSCSLDTLDDATATITAPDTETVWYEIDYDNCDVDDTGRVEVDLSGVDNDSVTFDIAECDGVITVYDAESGGDVLDSATIDCADATTSVTCSVDQTGDATATIEAPDTDPVWYEIDYQDCDEDDVSRTSLELPDDTKTFGIAECNGTITVYDGAGTDATEIASATFECADATVSVDCALDTLGDATATITAPDTDTVWYTTTYTDCDESGVSRKKVDLAGTDGSGNEIDSATVDLAECDGTIEVYDAASDGNLVASADIDCADANVEVNCEYGPGAKLDDATATITAPDADTVWYTTSYDNCDESGVTEKEVDLAGTDGSGNEIDSATVDLAECDGTIEVYDAASGGDLIASADIDCADAEVGVDCRVDTQDDATATIRAPDADTVWYEIDYDNCDIDDTGRVELDLANTDKKTIDIAECDGTIDVYDAASDGDLLATAEIDCADATVAVDCSVDTLDDATALITAPDTDKVWYAVSYDDKCEADDQPRTKVELTGSTDEVEVDLAECRGTITVHDAAEGGTKIAETTFNCGDADVAVDCTTNAFGDASATITAPDLDTVWYSTSYDNCDDGGVTRESVDLSTDDTAIVDLAECNGTIEIYDAASDGDLIASANIDCADAQVTVDCVDEVATITAPDTDVVQYEIVYGADCNSENVSKTEVVLGDDDEATVSIADCTGTITVYDLEGDPLASADFDCIPAVTALSADCEVVTADFTDLIAGDQVRIDVSVKDSAGTTITTVDSGTVTMASGGGGSNVTVNDPDGEGVFEQLVYTYSNDLDPGTAWQFVEVSVFLEDQSRFLDADPATDGFQQSQTFDVGPCGCPDCPDDLEVKFEEPGIEVCDENDGFVITDVTRDSEGELQSVCVATMPDRPVFCELGVCVKAGPETEKSVVEPVSTTFDETQCGFDVNGDGEVTADATIAEYCVSSFNDKAISHITIICPDDTCPEK